MWHLSFILVVTRITVAFGSVRSARWIPQNAGCTYKIESFHQAAGILSMDEIRQLPESLLQLTSQRRKPRNHSVVALSRGEILSTLELNNSAWRTNLTLASAVSEENIEHGRQLHHLHHLPSHRITRGVSATGELIQAGGMETSANPTETKAEWPSVSLKVHSELTWRKFVLSLLKTHSSGDGLAEGILVFILVNVFCCLVTTGMCFLYNARKGSVYEGMQDESEEEEPTMRVPRNGDHGYHQFNGRTAQDSHVAPSTRQPKPVTAGTWSPSFGGAHERAHPESHHQVRQSEPPISVRRHLCPELVVPRGSECVLAVRTLVSARLQQVEFDILDVNGKPVLQVEVSPQFQFGTHSRPWPAQLQRSPTIALKSLNPRESTGAYILCYCCNVTKEDESSGSKRNVYIYKDDGELFAHLMKDEIRKRYVLTSGRLGLQLLFEGNFEEHAVDVTNESRELLAATEPGVMEFDPLNKYYKLRVAADVDVGLVLCGLLAIDQMEVP